MIRPDRGPSSHGPGRGGTRLLVLGSVLVFPGHRCYVRVPNAALLLIFRAFQGLGGEVLIPLQLIILPAPPVLRDWPEC